MKLLTGAATAVSALAVLAILVFLAVSALPLFESGRFGSTLTGGWQPTDDPPRFGIGPMIAGSILLSLTALLLSFPLSLGVCSFMLGGAPRPLRGFISALVHFMTGIPTVVYGFVSVLLLVPLIRSATGGNGLSLLAACLTLSLLILPTITLMLNARLARFDSSLRLGCAALGMDEAQTQLSVLFPLAKRGMLAAAVLGFCRALGDTMIALMVSGNSPRWPSGILEPMRALTAHIGMGLATDTHSPEYRSIGAAGLVLFVLTGVLSLAIRSLGRASGEERRVA